MPELASIAEQWLQPVPSSETSEEILAGRRELSLSEKKEIYQASKKSQRFLMFALVLLVFSLMNSGKSFWIQGQLPANPIAFLVLIAIAIAYSIILAMHFRTMSRLRQDADNSWVMIVRQKASLHKTILKADQSGELTTYEVLPRSRRLWSLEGKPAPWRTASTAVDT